ncbi:hypothetical protein JTE90_012927 [Oedothorax gibbosus]|uniref:Midasin n=1 Tax=Oedothorax gibbosus TaxID=931172 RepID=A0AAV6V169_9ARAC|nr:hypothetical protein JTE90_012927 [Oedothorax gibbosus]
MDRQAILMAIKQLVAGDQLLTSIFSKYISKENCSKEECQAIINKLSDLLCNEKYTVKTAELFAPLLLELLTLASQFPANNFCDCYARHEWLSICMSKLIWNYPTVSRFAKLYFKDHYNLFWRYEKVADPPAKKPKTAGSIPAPYQLLKAAYLFLIYDTPFFKELWSWTMIVPFLKNGDVRARWYAHQCLGRVGNIKDSDLSLILEDNFTVEEFALCAKEGIELATLWNHKLYNPLPNELYKDFDMGLTCDLTSQTVNIQGILLDRLDGHGNESVSTSRMVCVASIAENLYNIALAITSSEPILLKGPVGCGKTSLVEHLAEVTGRCPSKEFYKVQLGDHIDSKMLLGTHCCTEVPGQFVWQPGVLIKAMEDGNWLLLEDIDCAPMDVISLLVPVLQSRSIVLPGHANPVKASPGFQLFATQRLLTGMDGQYVEFKHNAELIENLWRKITINPLTEAELTQVITTKWPALHVIIPRILEVYSLFSTDLRNTSETSTIQNQESFSVDLRHGRLTSMRDLFKFCGRIAVGFDCTKDETGVNVFKTALECFCDHIPNAEERLAAAEAIAVYFNITKKTAKHYMETYKPNIEDSDPVVIGRVFVSKKPKEISFERAQKSVFAHSRQAVGLLEKVAVSVVNKEPVLLVGETGTGKTSIVQYLSELTNQKLVVINMSQQSDSVDLLGGYKPVDFSYAVQPIKEDFLKMFPLVMDAVKNAKFLQHIYNCFAKKRFEELFKIMLHAQKNIVKLLHSKLNKPDCPCDTKAKADQWIALGQKIECMQKQLNQSKTALAFKFIEGALIKAMRSGEWLLLDEINLAEAETLECLAGVLENDDNALLLLEKGDNEPVKRHPDFHIFACMNPATDVGKKDLPAGIRSRFTEFFVEEVTNKSDLSVLVDAYLRSLAVNVSIIEKVVSFYSSIKISAAKELNDGTGHRPHYSLRTLCRALKYASTNPCHNVPRSLYEGFCLSFLSQLDQKSHAVVTKAITDRLLEKKKHSSILNQSIPEPANGNYVRIEGYWILGGGQEQEVPENYVFTDTVRQNLRDLARIVSAARYPVLLQGETSCGKTSLIEYLAKATGNKCVRVNNHEHTDIQEYVGTYSADEKGKLSFKEGVLVEAMRNGHWIILDELNLAPTEVMEALNRVLDDNRELFIAETQTIVKADPGFMIFATQNPAGQYGGRKVLSRAFRNRFIELHFNEIPPPELEIILSKRCSLAPSQSKKLVAVMQELQMRRKESGVFAGKQGFITLRDLFRWGERYQQFTQESEFYDWDQHLAEEGYLLLAGRVRHNEEAIVIQEVLKKHFKRNVDPDKLFDLHNKTSLVTRHILERCMKTKFRKTKHANIVWTRNLRRLAVLAGKAMDFNEPCLLVGNTGCGKTTICQMFGKVHKRELYSVNCHMHTEAADFLGGLRPVRDAKRRETQLFEWQDGPLIQAMLKGGLFLADEISLADHSVLERLNSVLEPEKKLFLTEKSFDNYTDSEIAAVDGFYFFATMNPGGDYGKKELSPALRNRFTEIWCPSDISEEAVVEIVKHNFNINEHGEMLGRDIAKFTNNYSDWSLTRTAITMRDILTWVEFMNTMIQIGLPPSIAYVHGAFLVFLDSLGSGQSTFANLKELNDIKKDILNFLENQIRKTGGGLDLNTVALCLPEITKVFHKLGIGHLSEHTFGIGPFQIQLGPEDILGNMDYELGSHSTKANAMRILRAMQLPRPILLEGSPGVGKTSLIDAIAKASGHKLVRINLSEQTDVSDLFGADLPVEGAESGEFAWRDGPLLQALKNQHWILLDELNLASQSVLEGLNACLDHRSEIFISELGRTLTFDKFTTRIFGCQNPYTQGGSRKGLPKSFLNRFTQVYVKPMDDADLFFITKQIYSQIPADLIERMLVFNHRMDSDINQSRLFGRQGAPFEFNLRDVFRWCKAILSNQSYNTDFNIGEYVKLIYADRMRTQADKLQVNDLYKDMSARHGESTILERPLELHVFEDSIQLGHASVERISRNTADTSMMAISTKQLPILESVMKCVELNWMPILVGPAGSGKSAIVRLLAELSGHQLHIMSVNSEMDTVELLGGFEQVRNFIFNELSLKSCFLSPGRQALFTGLDITC